MKHYFYCENCTREIGGIQFTRLNPGGGMNLGGRVVDDETPDGKVELENLQKISDDKKSGVHVIDGAEYAKMDHSVKSGPTIRHIDPTKGAIEMAKGKSAPVTVRNDDPPANIVDPETVAPVRPPKTRRGGEQTLA